MSEILKPADGEKKGILFACSLGSVSDVTRMLELGCDPRECNGSGEEAIVIAARYNSVGCVKKLLEAGVPVNVTSTTGNSLKFYAEHHKNRAMLNLIEKYEDQLNQVNRS